MCSKSTPAGWLGNSKSSPRLCPQACSRAPKRGFPHEVRRSNEASVLAVPAVSSRSNGPFAAPHLPPRTEARRLSTVWVAPGGGLRYTAANPRPAPTAASGEGAGWGWVRRVRAHAGPRRSPPPRSRSGHSRARWVARRVFLEQRLVVRPAEVGISRAAGDLQHGDESEQRARELGAPHMHMRIGLLRTFRSAARNRNQDCSAPADCPFRVESRVLMATDRVSARGHPRFDRDTPPKTWQTCCCEKGCTLYPPPTHNREPYDTLLYCPTSCSYRSVCGTDAACRLQF